MKEHGPGSDTQPERFPAWFYYVTLATLVWTIILLVVVALKINIVFAGLSTLAAIASLTGPATSILQFKVPKLPPIGRTVTQSIVFTVLAIEVAASAGRGGWSLHRATRDVDVLAKITLAKNKNTQPGQTAGLDVPVTADRDAIELIFRIVDHNPEAGNCAPFTELVVATSTGGNTGAGIRAFPGKPVRVDLSQGTKNLHLNITVKNTRNDRNCGVDLSVTSAKLKNK